MGGVNNNNENIRNNNENIRNNNEKNVLLFGCDNRTEKNIIINNIKNIYFKNNKINLICFNQLENNLLDFNDINSLEKNLEDNKYDIIMFDKYTSNFISWKNPNNYLEIIYRSLKDGGIFLFPLISKSIYPIDINYDINMIRDLKSPNLFQMHNLFSGDILKYKVYKNLKDINGNILNNPYLLEEFTNKLNNELFGKQIKFIRLILKNKFGENNIKFNWKVKEYNYPNKLLNLSV